jgi:hypothetical protein
MSRTGTPRFYPAVCHPGLSRRRFLAGAAALAAAGAGRAAAAADGGSIVRRHASAPEDPWMVAHGIRAMGRRFALRNGRSAVDFLLEDVLVTLPANGKGVLGFPPAVEVHPNSFLKTLLEAGVPPDHAFVHQGVRRTLADVVEGARALFRPQAVLEQANVLPWSLIALTRTTPPTRPEWRNAWGEAVNLDAAVEAALGLLERASAPLAGAMREGRPLAGKAPVHGFTCGGTHLIYSVLSAVQQGYGGADRRSRARAQVDILLWRLGTEPALIERFYERERGVPGLAWFVLDAKLKLLGHAEECLTLAARRGAVKLAPEQAARRRAATAALGRLLEELEGRDLLEVRALDRDLYVQLVGDVCHARHGLVT